MNRTATRGQVEAHIIPQRGTGSRFSRRGALAAASATVLSILASTPALAEAPMAPSADDVAASTPNSTVAEVVVTARRRGERVIDVPESLTAMTGDDLKKAGVDSLDDLGHMVPNVLFNRRGDNEPNVVIRGIGSFGNVQGVNFYFDEVPNFTDQASRLVDLERVEVLKGPQGTLYGGAAIGGAVKYITRQPSDTFEGGIGAEVGQERTANINGWVNIPLSDKVYLLTSAYSDNTNGYSKNPITGNNNDESHEYGARAALRFAPSASTDITATIRYSYLNNGGNDYVLENGTRDYRYINPLDVDVFSHRQIWSGALQVRQDIGDLKLVSVTSFTERQQRFHFDLDYTAADTLSSPADGKPQQTPAWTQEVRLASPDGQAVTWVVGLFGSRVKDRQTAIRGDVMLGSALTHGGPIRLANFHNSHSVDDNLAAFGSATYTMGAMEFTAGGRVNYNRFLGTNLNTPESLEVEDTTFLPKLTAAYKPRRDLNLYVTYSQGYEPGRANVFSDPVVAYKPETTKNLEAGAKGELYDGRMTYEVAGYYVDNAQRQFETQVLSSGGVPEDLVTNIGDAKSYGLEGAITVRPAAGLTLSASGGYLHSNFATATFNQQAYHDVQGPFAPSLTGTASVDYSHPLGDDLMVSVRADLTHTGKFYWDVPNQYAQEAYDLVGLRFAVASVRQNWELALRANNIFNTRYNNEFIGNFKDDPTVDPAAKDPQCNRCNLARPGQPRMVVATFSYRY